MAYLPPDLTIMLPKKQIVFQNGGLANMVCGYKDFNLTEPES
jgi:hypothetical protein